MSKLLKNMFRGIAQKYGHVRSPTRTRARTADSPVLDLSHRGRRSRSGSLKRRHLSSEEPTAPENAPQQKQKGLILPPPPEKTTRIYGGRTDPYDALGYLRTDNSFEFDAKTGGIWLNGAELKIVFLSLICIFITSILVAFSMGYRVLSSQMDVSDIPALPDGFSDATSSRHFADYSDFELSELELFKHRMAAVNREEFEPEIPFDFSLSSLGAKILTTRDTQAVVNYDASLLGGYSVWSGLYSDMQSDATLQPILIPGRCWRFHGFPGTLVVQLAERIVVTSFTLSHTLGASVPKSRLKPAPFEFEVWGLQAVDDQRPHLFGNYTFSLSGTSNQDFSVMYSTTTKTPIVELKVLSNYGSKDYTCVYRFKVFGTAHDQLDETN